MLRMPLPLRWRLTLWYSGVLTVLLSAGSLAAYRLFITELESRIDAEMIANAALVRAGIERSAGESGTVSLTADTPRAAVSAFRSSNLRFFLYEPERGQTAASQKVGIPELDDLQPLLQLPDVEAAADSFATVSHRGTNVRLLFVPMIVEGRGAVVIAARSMAAHDRFVAKIVRLSAIALLLTVGLSSTIGYLLALRALAPIERIISQASAIGAASLSDRITTPASSDELARLSSVLNDLLDRLERSFSQQQAFMADASHELRTPVSIIRGEAEVTLSRSERSESEYRESITIILDEAQRLSAIVANLLLLARADSGSLPVRREAFDLGEAIMDSFRNARRLVDGQHLASLVDPSIEYPFAGDEGLIRQLVMNLLENAIKHTPGGGRVTVSLRMPQDVYEIVVEDEGGGVDVEAREKIFERFFRLERARDERSGTGGAGLGLPIARWIAEAHGGTLELRITSPRGSMFVATLPRVDV